MVKYTQIAIFHESKYRYIQIHTISNLVWVPFFKKLINIDFLRYIITILQIVLPIILEIDLKDA